ncbi:MAG: type II toxin-antitoxin system YafQ family toxin [Bifidobacteriaceae bacterium]|jgi:mRNA interferase YafQ|nr:type II toxin-antitoxin system YafQ family toxin [Bifidobacteriaceae bacterium]
MAASLVPTSRYRKDLKRLQARGADMGLLDQIVDTIAAGGELPERFRRHALKGDRLGQVDVHIRPDWLLLYEPTVINGQEVIILRRTGSHSDLFA